MYGLIRSIGFVFRLLFTLTRLDRLLDWIEDDVSPQRAQRNTESPAPPPVFSPLLRKGFGGQKKPCGETPLNKQGS